MGLRKVLITFVAIIFALNSWSSHIMGGDISYTYMGQQASGDYRYEITFTIFGNCDPNSSPPSNWPTPMPEIDFGIYMEGADPNADKEWIADYETNLTSTSFFSPDLPPGCTFSASICAWEAKYVQIVDLPTSLNGNFANGYHIVYDVCCRNGAILNLDNPQSTGSEFYAFIPNPLLVNSSPVFSDSPLPFLCVGDTTPLLNTAFDPDGDLLVFSFEEPYQGHASTADPQPDYSGPFANADLFPNYIWPSPLTTWAAGYNASQPFGSAGFASINGFTGASEYMSSIQGPFVVAVEIKEYRNGNLIGITRRDMQFQVVQCAANPIPILTNSGPAGDTLGSGTTNYVIEEGDTLCFDILFDDSNNDDITLSSNGIIFDPAITAPEATINTPQTGTASVEATFCWETGCDQGRPQPYLFTVNAKDDGCLPQTGAEAYAILISEFNGPTSINGPVNVCSGSLGVNYSVSNITDATYSWALNGGTVTSGQGTNSIDVDWSQGVLGEVSVTTTSANGCSVAPINLLINIIDINIDAGRDTSICVGDTVALGGTPTAPGGYALAWSPSAELDNGGSYNPNAFPSADTQFILTVSDGAGCFAYDTVSVTLFNISITISNDMFICPGDSVQLNATGGTNYIWSPNSAIDNINVPNPTVFPVSVSEYTVTVSNANGCQTTDSVLISLYPDIIGDAGTDAWVCPGDSAQLNASGGISYSWSPAFGLSSSSIANPMANPGIDTAYTVIIGDAQGCLVQDTVWVYSANVVPTEAGNNATICPEDSIMLGGNPTAPLGSTYLWLPATGLSSNVAPNPMARVTAPTWYYVYTTNDTCSGVDSVFIDLHIAPIIDAGANVQICIGDTTQLIASGGLNYSWTPNDSLSDDSIFNPLAYPSDTNKYYVIGEDVNSCFARDSVTIIVNPLPLAYAGPDIQICLGDTAELIATGGNIYNWSGINIINTSNDSALAFPSDTMNYVVEVTDSNACVLTDTMTVVFNPLPVIDAGLNREICIFDTTLLVASGGINYTWTPSNSLSNSNNDSSFAWPIDTTMYTVQVTDTNGCINVDSIVITVNPLPIVDAGVSRQICAGDTAQLIATGGDTYIWTPALDLSNPNSSSTDAWPTDTTMYVVQVTDSNTCFSQDSIEITVNPLPVAYAGLDVQICTFDTTKLIATGGDIYSWTPTDSLASPVNDTTLSWPSDTTIYTVQVTDSNFCVNWDSVSVIVNPLPLVDAGINRQICIFDTTLLVASGGINYTWTPANSLSNSNNDSSFAWPIDTTMYTVQVTDTNGCINVDSVVITVNPLPIVDAGVSRQICAGDTAQLIATGGNTYVWTPALNLSNPNSSSTDAWPTDTTMYVVQVTDSNTCFSQDSIEITVNPLPIAYAGLDVQICTFDTTKLIATGGDIYSWTPTDSLASPVNDTTLSWPSDTAIYTVQVTDSNFCVNWDSVSVIVNPLPLADAGPNLWLCPTDTIEMIATGGDVYSWLITASIGSPNNDTTLIWPLDTIDYIVEVIDSNGCVFWDTTNVVVNTVVPTDAGPDTSLCYLDSIVIGGSPTSPTGTTYSWNTLLGMNDSTYANPTVSPADTFIYSLETVNHICNGTDTVQVIVNPLPIVDAGADVQICLYGTTELIANGGDIYSWLPIDSLSNPDSSATFANPIDTTEYFVLATDSNGCMNTDSVTITVNPFPLVDAGPNIQICISDTALLVASGGEFYAWTPADSLLTPSNDSTLAYPTDTAQYFVLVTDSNGCVNNDSIIVTVNPYPIVDAGLNREICIGDITELIANGGDLYSWAPLDSLQSPTNDTTDAWPTDTTLYFVQVTDSNGCVSIDSVQITVNPLPTINAGLDVQICILDTTQLIATGGHTYIWTPAFNLASPNNDSTNVWPIDTTEYMVTAIDSNACSNIDLVAVIVNPLPIVNAGLDTTSCNATPVILGGTPTGPALSDYAWSPNFEINDSTLANPTVDPTQTNTYWVLVTDSNSCIDSDTVTVNIFAIEAIEDTSICQFTDIVLFVNTFSGIPPYIYNWAPNNDLTTTNYDTTTASPTEPASYFLSVTDGHGCLERDTVNIEVYESPMAIFEYTLLPSCEGLKADFINQSTEADSYFWEFQDGETSTETEPSTLFNYNEDLVIRLIALNNSGCSDTTDYTEPINEFTQYVELNPANVFTPNGDGINDLFEIQGDFDLTGCVRLIIYNRWGTMVFSSSDNFATWDGRTFAGEEVPGGVYFYVLEINGMIFKESVTLSR